MFFPYRWSIFLGFLWFYIHSIDPGGIFQMNMKSSKTNAYRSWKWCKVHCVTHFNAILYIYARHNNFYIQILFLAILYLHKIDTIGNIYIYIYIYIYMYVCVYIYIRLHTYVPHSFAFYAILSPLKMFHFGGRVLGLTLQIVWLVLCTCWHL